jgi:hypothetical protein
MGWCRSGRGGLVGEVSVKPNHIIQWVDFVTVTTGPATDDIKSIESELKANRFSPLWIRSCLPNPLLLANVIAPEKLSWSSSSSFGVLTGHSGCASRCTFAHCCGERCIPGRGNDIYIYIYRVSEREGGEGIMRMRGVRERESSE